MGYLDEYRKRVFLMGTNEKDRLENNRKRDFEQYLKYSPGRTEYIYNDEKYEGVLISGTRTAAQLEMKIVFYMVGRESDRMPEGGIFTTYDRTYQKTRYWIILNAEVKSYYGYIRYKLLELDYILKYIDKKGVLQEAPAYVVSTGTFDIKEYFKFIAEVSVQVPYRAINVVWTAHPEIDNDTKFIIGDEVWRYVDSDKISIPGLYYTTLYKTQQNLIYDSEPDQLADIQKIGNIDLISNFGENIVIGQDNTSLKFYIRKNKRIISSSQEIISKTPEMISIEKTQVIPVKTGQGTILVKDKITGYEKLINVKIEESQPDYFAVVGDASLPSFEPREFYVNTNQDFTISFDQNYLDITQEGNKLKVTGQKIGLTQITFEVNQKTYDYPIEVMGAWVI